MPGKEELERWGESRGVTIGPLCPSPETREQLLRLLYAYKDLDGQGLDYLPPTDLIQHRTRIKEGVKPYSVKTQKRWSPTQEWWLRELITQGIEGGVYESTLAANGRLSEWNSRAVLVKKSEKATPEEEPRLTFNYSNLEEYLPGCEMELAAKVLDYLSDPRHKCFFQADLKHAYFTIPVHPEDRHVFAFTIPGLGQLQPTRMPQGTSGASFTLNACMGLIFGPIPEPSPEPSLLDGDSPNSLAKLAYYMDDILGGTEDPEDLLPFLRDHFLPRVLWSGFKLSFKKLKLYMDQVNALGVDHHTGGLLKVRPNRISKIVQWPTPTTATEVRAFIGSMGITRKWIKNYSEAARPLFRLMGKTQWRWGSAEELSFSLLKMMAAKVVDLHGMDWTLPIHLYVDTSGYATGACGTQIRLVEGRKVEVPILYDSVILSKTQRKYPNYKRELFGIVRFTEKYRHYFQDPTRPGVVHTDHKPLTHFLKGDSHEGIYAHWVSKLRLLYLSIEYIPGPRNKVADGLSRTIFYKEECQETPVIEKACASLPEGWIWKDGKGGYEELIKRLEEEADLSPGSGLGEGGASAPIQTQIQVGILQAEGEEDWTESYRGSEWFGEIFRQLVEGVTTRSKARSEALEKYRIKDARLWKEDLRIQQWLLCIPEERVKHVLREAHDRAGHWGKEATLARIRRWVYWPNQSEDVRDYILGCEPCARNTPVTRVIPQLPADTSYPLEMMGMDYAGPFETTAEGFTHILHLVDYFSLYSVSLPAKGCTAAETVRLLNEYLRCLPPPRKIYCDPGPHFTGKETKKWAESNGIELEYRAARASRSTGKVEGSIKMLEEVMAKLASENSHWASNVTKASQRLNGRITGHLRYTPAEIMFGVQGQQNPILPKEERAKDRTETTSATPAEVYQYMTWRAEVQEIQATNIEERNKRKRSKYASYTMPSYHHGDLVFVKQDRPHKLEPKYRGPFLIDRPASERGTSYWITYRDGRPFPYKVHVKDLKLFVPRMKHLYNPALDTYHPDSTLRASIKRRRPRTAGGGGSNPSAT